MRKDLEQTLVDEFPGYFEYYYDEWGDGEQPQPPIYAYGIQCRDGWYSLVYRMCKELDEAGIDLKIHQIKQKFGSLRFYHGGINTDENEYEKYAEIRNRYREESEWTCEECGQNAHMPSDPTRSLCWECSPLDKGFAE